MKLFIGKDYEGRPISVILTKSEQLANAFWQGKVVVVRKRG